MDNNKDCVIQLSKEDDILSPRYDGTFKSIFTMETPEAKIALMDFISTFLDKKVTEVKLMPNEPPIENEKDKALRFDIRCKFDDNERANIEMQLHPGDNELVRSELYLCKLHAGQPLKGKGYSEVKNTYQITIVANETVISEDDEFFHKFEYYDKINKVSYKGKTFPITIELSKLKKILKKDPDLMNDKEAWAIFFKYGEDIKNRDLINKIIKKERGVRMAASTLLTISKDEMIRDRIFQEKKKKQDAVSDRIDSLRKGRAEGIAIGRAEMAIQKSVEIAKKMLRRNYKIEDIADDTGLSIQQIEELR
ncbi:MAG: PD-(D/E)XK nuclease family transposase [Candidatus Improbicoccus pseudotrichonymphae]|uniref:PD-(D/E)XK nuclease family transposase n=1 Tax=Candidatus Improbicoccus pseudotrichonymphae TaxID=3033792 RepID=A0AA48HXT5_9FIRM|nr:MAG: PD-(D/E)XK nuclease family transposase [Candidatus Improbicoccus pseudotrichonymphae]